MWTIELDVNAESDGTREDLRSLLVAAAGELRKDPTVRHARMWATLADNSVTFKGGISIEDREEAARAFSAAVRGALHEVGCHTPGWVEKTEQLIAALPNSRMVAERIDDRVAA